jgi:hypothetical protein
MFGALDGNVRLVVLVWALDRSVKYVAFILVCLCGRWMEVWDCFILDWALDGNVGMLYACVGLGRRCGSVFMLVWAMKGNVAVFSYLCGCWLEIFHDHEGVTSAADIHVERRPPGTRVALTTSLEGQRVRYPRVYFWGKRVWERCGLCRPP